MAKARAKKSLTREMFLKDLVVKPTKVELNGVVLYIKPVSELRRSQRSSMMFDKNGNIEPKFMENRRMYNLIDHLCDENCEPIFSDKDIKELQELDSVLIDPYFAAIHKVLGEDEGNE